jgi:hypothetical protein
MGQGLSPVRLNLKWLKAGVIVVPYADGAVLGTGMEDGRQASGSHAEEDPAEARARLHENTKDIGERLGSVVRGYFGHRVVPRNERGWLVTAIPAASQQADPRSPPSGGFHPPMTR